MTTSARVLVPITITDAMILAGTSIAEPAAGETAWVPAGTYALGDECIRATTHKVYECVQAHTGRTALPEVDSAYWKEARPTMRWAPFDDYANTQATAVTSLTYVLQPGFLNGLHLDNLVGTGYSVTVKDAPGGTVIASWSGDLYEQAAGPYELLYCPLLQLTSLSFDDIPLAPAAEVTITITSTAGQPVGIGSIKAGDWRQFIGTGSFGGAQYGASSDLNNYSYRKYNADGTYTTVKRAASIDVNCAVVIDAEQAMYADAIRKEIKDVAVPFEASGLPRYGYLKTVGFVTLSIKADNSGATSLNIIVKGTI